MNFEFRQKSISFRTAVVAVVIGTLIGFLLVALFGYNPVEIFSALLDGAFGSGKNIATSLRWATPLMFTGVAAALSFRGECLISELMANCTLAVWLPQLLE